MRVLCVSILSFSMTAMAQSAPQVPYAPEPAAVPPAASAPTQVQAQASSASGIYADANSDRVFLTPTAETQPKGTVSFSDYELFILGLTYGINDNLHITVATLPPLVEDMPLGLFTNLKLKFVDNGKLKVAATGSFFYYMEDDSDFGDDNLSVVSGGAVASLCLDNPCDSLLSLSGSWWADLESDEIDNAFTTSVSATKSLSRHAKFLAELTTGGSAFEEGEDSGWGEVWILGYGVRFHGGSFAGDVGFLKPLGDSGEDHFVLGFPWLSFTYRWQ